MPVVEILFRELVRLLGALISALLSQSWQPLEGALGETGAVGVAGLLVISAGAALLLLLLGLVALGVYYRRRIRVAAREGVPIRKDVIRA